MNEKEKESWKEWLKENEELSELSLEDLEVLQDMSINVYNSARNNDGR